VKDKDEGLKQFLEETGMKQMSEKMKQIIAKS